MEPRRNRSAAPPVVSVMKRALILLAVAGALLAGGALAQSPPAAPPATTKPPIPQRTVNITAEQGYVIKENVKDTKPANVDAKTVEIGGKAPAGIELHDFPPFVQQKVSAIKTYKFFVTDDNNIVVVDPKDRTIGDILK
jgi:hypothetical protein